MKLGLKMSLVLLMMVGMMMPAQAQCPQRGNRPNCAQQCCPQGSQKRQGDPAKMAEMRAERMTKELGLSEDQKAELVEFFKKEAEAQKAELKQAVEKRRGDRKVAMEERKAKSEARKAELTKIIGEENMKKVEEMQKKQGKHPQGGRPQGRGPRN